MRVSSRIVIDQARIKNLSQSAVMALEKTGEALHTEVVQAQVIPRDTGALQNESTFVEYSRSKQGEVTLISATPYARKMYFHPEFHFSTDENPDAKGKWYEDWMEGGKQQNFAAKAFKEFYRGEADL